MTKDEQKILNGQEKYLKEILEERQSLIRKYNQLLDERNHHEWKNQLLQQELNSVYGSRKWKFGLWIGNIVCRILPPNSKRRKLIKGIYNFLRSRRLHIQTPKTTKTKTEDIPLVNGPKISIIMPVYNVEERFLVDAIESVLAQTYKNWELCIVDDASTKKYIRPLLEHYAILDKRIKVKFSKENAHIAATSNKAIRMATGKYIAFLDNDDMLCPETLFLCVNQIFQKGEIDLLYTDNYLIDEKNNIVGKLLKPNWSPEGYLATNYLVHFCLYSTKILQKVGGLNEDIHFRGTQDTELKGRIIQHTKKIVHLEACVYKWRIHAGSVSLNISEKRYMIDNSILTFQNILNTYYNYPSGQIVMPVEAQNSGNGYFTVVFPKKIRDTLIIIPVSMEDMCNDQLLKKLEEFSKKEPIQVLVACRCLFSSKRKDTFYKVTDQSQKALCRAVRDSGAEQVLLLSNDIDKMSLESIRNVAGFAMLSDEIGACGGKILSKDLRIMEGAYLLMNHLQIMHGGLDRAIAYQELCTQNCSAVTGGFMAIRASTFLKYKGPDYQKFGKLADVDFCLRMRKDGLRIVYNPRAEVRTLLPTENVMMGLYITKEYELLYKKYQTLWGKDPYFNPSYSQDMQYMER